MQHLRIGHALAKSPVTFREIHTHRVQAINSRAAQFEQAGGVQELSAARHDQGKKVGGRAGPLFLPQIIDVHASVAVAAQPVEDGGMDAPEEALTLEMEFLPIVPVAATVDDDGVVGRDGGSPNSRFVI